MSPAKGARRLLSADGGVWSLKLCADCVSDGGEYIRAGGTSMSAPMVAGAAAIGFQLDPTLTPNRIKALLRDSDRPLTDSIDELSMVDAARRFFNDGGRLANQGLEPNTYIDPATGEIDYTRSRWSRSRWSEAGELLRSSWSRSSWSLAPDSLGTDSAAVATARSSWSRSSWSTSWTK
jgi:subtilisin family serine protease